MVIMNLTWQIKSVPQITAATELQICVIGLIKKTENIMPPEKYFNFVYKAAPHDTLFPLILETGLIHAAYCVSQRRN